MRNIENEIYRIKPVEELRFTDDFMFCRVMQSAFLESKLNGLNIQSYKKKSVRITARMVSVWMSM